MKDRYGWRCPPNVRRALPATERTPTVNTETPPPTHNIGSTEPTAEKVATAGRLLDLHRAINIPMNNFCSWCLKAWPCPDVAWSEIVLARSGRAHD